MSAVTVKKSCGCGDKGPPEPLSPAAAPLSCQVFIVHHHRIHYTKCYHILAVSVID